MVKGISWPLAAAGAVTQRARTAVSLLCFAAAAAAPIGASAYSPYFSAPAKVPGTIEAETFDRGGEGVGYHDATWSNYLGALRPYEGVDIRADPRAPGNNWIVSSIEVGEWTAYTINVTVAGEYDWGLLTSTPYSGAAFHLEIDGWNKTGRVTVPNTSGWDAFRWAGAPKVWLNQGWYVLKVVSEGDYFDLDSIVLSLGQPAQAPPPPPPPQSLPTSVASFACSFNWVGDCGFVEQGKIPGRASLTTISRDGGTALRLHTDPGDTGVVYSGSMERNDVYLARPGTADPVVYGEGAEQWWSHSILFPDDFVVPTTQPYTVFDFHNTGTSHAQANFNLAFKPQADITQPGALNLVGYGGPDIHYGAVLGQVQKNLWYDFVYHVRWSSGWDGFFAAWVNGKAVLDYRGPTLYSGEGTYLKLANYHLPVCNWYPGCVGDQASSVIHDRIIRGTTAQAVAPGPLDGYLDLINGVLTPRW